MLWKLAMSGESPAVEFAAQELKRCLERMDSEAEVPIFRFAHWEPSLTDMLWLAVDPALAAKVEEPELDDAYRIQVEAGSGCILGSNARSVLLGAYRFLKELGCVWTRPGKDGEGIPQRPTAEVKVCLEEKASYRHRGVCIEGSVSYDHVADMIDWLPKVGMNGYFNQFDTPVTFYNRWYEHRSNPLREGAPLSNRQIQALRDQTVAEIKKRGMLYHAAGHGWTCEPFGIPGEAWEPGEYDVPESARECLALVDGKRALWHNVPLNTNLCYSNPKVRQTMADAVVAKCRQVPQIDYVQVWLADGTNNHCQCDDCQKMRPSDWYVTLLNDIDRAMTQAGLSTRVVFLMYVDLLWEPQQVRLENPERFVLMFAPITRTYSSSIADAPEFDEGLLPPFRRNQLQFPKSVSENLAWMRRWRRQFQGDGFAYDYHFMWDHFYDPGYYAMAKTLFRDMQALHSVGLNGMISCQNQRVFFPTGFGMAAMAAALWDEQADFDTVARNWFRDAFGADGPAVQAYMAALSEAFDPVYLRGDRDGISPENEKKLEGVAGVLESFRQTLEARVKDETLPTHIHASWNYLAFHADYCRRVADIFLARARGEETDTAKAAAILWAWETEPQLHSVFDAYEFMDTMNKRFSR